MRQEEEAKGGQGAGAKFRIDPWEREDDAGRRSFGATCVLEGYVRALNNGWVGRVDGMQLYADLGAHGYATGGASSRRAP